MGERCIRIAEVVSSTLIRSTLFHLISMRLSLQSLPVLQNWDCHACGECCREYEIHITEEERQRIVDQGWENDPVLKGTTLFTKVKRFSNQYKLNHRKSDDGCVFLDEKGLCRIHAKFGEPAKPLACRVYPFILIPVGKQWKVGLRFACPSVTKNIGKTMEGHLPELREYAEALEKRANVREDTIIPAPALQTVQKVDWSDLQIFAQHFRKLISDNSDWPMEYRLRVILGLIEICRNAQFDKVTGKKLEEFLALLTAEVVEITVEDGDELPPPGWIGRILFRQISAVFCRKDKGPQQGISRRGRIALLVAAWRFVRGRGPIPKTHRQIPDGTFEDAEKPTDGLTDEAEDLFERYFRVKLDSLQFCGATNHHRMFWDGLESLLLTFPIICWLARVLHDRPNDEAFRWALQVVDDNFGFNKLLESKRYVYSTQILAKKGELAKLIAWYAR